MDDVTDKLLRDGVEAFLVPMEKLLAGIESKREAVVTGRPTTIESVIPDDLEPRIAERVKKAVEEDVAQRVWQKDESLWGGPGVPEIGNRLGWLTIADAMLEEVPRPRGVRAKACRRTASPTPCCSAWAARALAPEVFRRSFGDADGLRLHVLDSTDAGRRARGRGRHRPLEDALHRLVQVGRDDRDAVPVPLLPRAAEGGGRREPGSHFVAVTDPGSKLLGARRGERLPARVPERSGHRRPLLGAVVLRARAGGPDGRGHRGAARRGARWPSRRCQGYDKSVSNSGLWLGCTLGELSLAGRDKATFVVDDAGLVASASGSSS